MSRIDRLKQALPTAVVMEFSKENRMVTYQLQTSTLEEYLFQLLSDSNFQNPTLLLLDALDGEAKIINY